MFLRSFAIKCTDNPVKNKILSLSTVSIPRYILIQKVDFLQTSHISDVFCQYLYIRILLPFLLHRCLVRSMDRCSSTSWDYISAFPCFNPVNFVSERALSFIELFSLNHIDFFCNNAEWIDESPVRATSQWRVRLHGQLYQIYYSLVRWRVAAPRLAYQHTTNIYGIRCKDLW